MGSPTEIQDFTKRLEELDKTGQLGLFAIQQVTKPFPNRDKVNERVYLEVKTKEKLF
jgi:hypothetical protein